jgi:TatD DNase family protein
MFALIDSHNHLHDHRLTPDRVQVIADMQRECIEHAIVNGTSEADWQDVQELHMSNPDFLSPAFGLHPWKVKDRSPDWLEKLRHFLKSPRASIGECGLDQWLVDADIYDQVAVLRDHIKLSRELDRPLTLHCLKAWPELFALLKESKPIPPFLLHSFGGPSHLIQPLLKLGAHFSFSGYFLHERKRKALENFRLIPADRLMVETDAPDMAPPKSLLTPYQNESFHHPADLRWCMKGLAEVRGESPKCCAEQCRSNSIRLFALTSVS